MPVVLDLGSLRDAVAEADEDLFELALDLGDEVEVPAPAPVAAGGQVEAVAFGRRRGLGAGQLVAPAATSSVTAAR